jgi:putative PIN family toxin of toxin-antitoxin system
MEKDIVVIDTSVWLSIILKNKIHLIVALAVSHHVSVFVCPELMDEISRNIFNDDFFKRHISNPSDQLQFIREITINQVIDQRFDRAADIKDNFLFDLAYTVKSFYLVTGEKQLLNMKQVNNIHIISPVAYFKLFDLKW